MQSKKHILPIDDEPEVAEMLKDFFEKPLNLEVLLGKVNSILNARAL